MNVTALFETSLINRRNNPIEVHGTIYTAVSGAHVFSSGPFIGVGDWMTMV
jgi:hypothetical protein